MSNVLVIIWRKYVSHTWDFEVCVTYMSSVIFILNKLLFLRNSLMQYQHVQQDTNNSNLFWSRPQLFEGRLALNPLSPKSDQHQISPCNINSLSNRVVMSIMNMITQDEIAWYFINYSPLLLYEMSRGRNGEIKFWS